MRLPSRKAIQLAIGAVVLLAAVVVVIRPASVAVETASVERGLLRITVDEEGRTRVHDHFVVAAPVAGKLGRIDLHEGDRVEPDMVVARIEPVPLDERSKSEAEARLAAARAAKQAADARFEQAKAALGQAVRARARTDALVVEGLKSSEDQEEDRLAETTAEREVDAASFAVQVARYEVEAARAALIAANPLVPSAAVSDATETLQLVRSPVGGRVFRVQTRSEQVVAAGTPLLELGDTSALEAVVDVLSPDAVRIRPGAMMIVEDWGGDAPLLARVRLVEPSAFTKVSALGVEEQRVNVIGDFLNAPARLGDGYRIEARIVIWESEDVLKIPTNALFRDGSGWAVFAVDNGRARLRHVDIGNRNTSEAELLGGLVEGAEVVLYPSDQLEDGSRVLPSGASS